MAATSSASSSSPSDWETFNVSALRFLRERSDLIKRVDAAVERALESMPRLERREGEEGEKEEESRSTSASFAAPEASSSSPLLVSSTSTSTSTSSTSFSPSFSLEAFDEWHERARAALGEIASGGGGEEPAT